MTTPPNTTFLTSAAWPPTVGSCAPARQFVYPVRLEASPSGLAWPVAIPPAPRPRAAAATCSRPTKTTLLAAATPPALRLRAPVGLPDDPPLILGAEPPACRLIGYLRVRSNAIELGRFARNSSRPTGSFRSAQFFLVFFFFDHQHRLTSFPPCTLINVQASVSPMLAQRAIVECALPTGDFSQKFSTELSA